MFHSWVETMATVTPTVRRQRMRIVRNFLLYYARRHSRTPIPDLSTFPKPGPHQPPRLVSAREMARVLATAASLPPTYQNPLRAETIRLALALLFCCGLRRGELLRLKIRDFVPRENLVRVEATKFHKSRLVPLSDLCCERGSPVSRDSSAQGADDRDRCSVALEQRSRHQQEDLQRGLARGQLAPFVHRGWRAGRAGSPTSSP